MPKRFKYKINKPQLIGLILALIIVITSFIFFRETDVFYFLFGIAFLIAGLPFFVSLILESNSSREKEMMFLEFIRDLVESVRTGVPISKSILNIREKNYGSLSPYINKLANQIAIGIPIKTSLETFSRDIGNPTITRAITIISESEKAGGHIESILQSVAQSVSQTEKLKKERRAAMYSLIVQGYIIFFIFIIIMLVMQFRILPIASELAGIENIDAGTFGSGFSGGERATPEELARPFFWLLIVQGFFAGIVIGKLSEGKIKAGLKHSFILIIFSLLISTGARLFLS